MNDKPNKGIEADMTTTLKETTDPTQRRLIASAIAARILRGEPVDDIPAEELREVIIEIHLLLTSIVLDVANGVSPELMAFANELKKISDQESEMRASVKQVNSQ
jgi:hypothetical protein